MVPVLDSAAVISFADVIMATCSDDLERTSVIGLGGHRFWLIGDASTPDFSGEIAV
jgi:hypothetical protein